ncbi:MAG: flagellar hook-length control protein FliK [Gammaproteobacteria bacterium]|nr:flagellar hook-length control protein FliK [Gammaproteobacteria bacterium]
MFQMPLLGSGVPGLLKGSGPDAAGGNVPDGSPQGMEGLMSGFSGELQAMLMQMSPQMLQQLEELLAGGMSLPQAAKSLLAEARYDGAGGLFDNLFEDGVSALQEQLQFDQTLQRSATESGLAKLAGDLRSGSVGISLAGLSEAISSSMAPMMPVSGQNPVGSTLSPQLAASLLDMGVPQQVGGKGWSGAIADRLMWMVQGDQQFARLQLNPPHLGPLEVRVSVHQDQTSVSFLAQHAAVREALEAALPRLREMFDQQSLQLVRADVSDPGAQREGGADDASAGSANQHGLWGDGAQEDMSDSKTTPLLGAADSLVDLFA